MRLLSILLEESTNLTGTIQYSIEDFSDFKKYVKEKFQEEDNQEEPPFTFDIYDDPDRGSVVRGYFSKANILFEYIENDFVLKYDPEVFSKEEVEQFSSFK